MVFGGVLRCVVVCPGVSWCVRVSWCVVACPGVWWLVLVCGGVWWCVVACPGVWWCVTVCNGVSVSSVSAEFGVGDKSRESGWMSGDECLEAAGDVNRGPGWRNTPFICLAIFGQLSWFTWNCNTQFNLCRLQWWLVSAGVSSARAD